MDFFSLGDPLLEIDRFRTRATSEGLALPEAMTLATVDAGGDPQARVVLLKGRSGREVHFFTNYESPKAQELAAHPRASLCMHYPSLVFQARVLGDVKRLSEAASDAYFATRPRESQIGAWASKQSAPLRSREELDRAYAEAEERYRDREVPRPPHWGGFALTATQVELWYGREGRLHDRARYTFAGGAWQCELLSP